MEPPFELLMELFGEAILQLVFEALAEAGLHFIRSPGREAVERSAWKLTIGYALFGLIAGGASLLVFPHSFLHHRNGRIANLVLTPLVSGIAMVLIGAWRLRRGQQLLGLDRFAYGYLFALAMASVRFSFAD
jgi:hypothetical protein